MGKKVFSVKHIAKAFGEKGERNYVEVLKDISMDIEEKEFIVILGNSGCGVTLRALLCSPLAARSKRHYYRHRGSRCTCPIKIYAYHFTSPFTGPFPEPFYKTAQSYSFISTLPRVKEC